MTVRLTWVDNNVDETGHQIYRSTSPMDPAALPAPIATLAADVTTYDDTTAPADTDCYYRVAAVRNGELAVSSESMINTGTVVAPTPPAIGEYWTGQGGYYAGDITYADGRQFHLVVADKSADITGANSQWKTSNTTTAGTTNLSDGMANTESMIAAGIELHPAANHCVNYAGGENSDWYLPAKDELNVIYLNLNPSVSQSNRFANGGAQAFNNWHYWSSTEFNSAYPWSQLLTDGTIGNVYAKTQTFQYVRPIRRVAKAS